jgi:hypothetical protein
MVGDFLGLPEIAIDLPFASKAASNWQTTFFCNSAYSL